MGNIVAIVGRPNVGKSTLFNRLTGARKAIVDSESGVTRDRHYGKAEWIGREFNVVDTGGYITNSGDVFEEEIRKQIAIAIEEADVIIFLLDVLSGITDLDESIADILRKTEKKVIPVVNKVDNSERYYDASLFYKLGLGDIYPVSAVNGSGTGDLLDVVVKELPESEKHEESTELPRFAIVGRPNVGKSSLLNSLLGEERNIVTPVSGTTRDSIYTRFNKFRYDFFLVDTAGLRKKTRVRENIEFYSILRSIRAIENSDVCLLMIDALQGIESQDVNIFNLIKRNNKGVVILVNKWDLVEKSSNTARDFTVALKKRIAPFDDVPVLFISAVNRQRIFRVLEAGSKVYENLRRRIPTHLLNKIIQDAVESFHPPAARGRHIKIKYATQLPSRSPAFAMFSNYPQYIREPYKRYLEHRIREHFDFCGVPLQIYFRKK